MDDKITGPEDAAEKSTQNDASSRAEEGDTASMDNGESTVHIVNPADPLNFGRHRHDNPTSKQMKIDHPNGNGKKLKKFYTRQNELIEQFLGIDDEERLTVQEDIRMAPKIKFAVYGSFTVNLGLFVIQMYAAISTGSLALFATAADAFVCPRPRNWRATANS
jgi:hypothetical protein